MTTDREVEYREAVREELMRQRVIENAWLDGQEVEQEVGPNSWAPIDRPVFAWSCSSYRIKRKPRVLFFEKLSDGTLSSRYWLNSAPMTSDRTVRFVEELPK